MSHRQIWGAVLLLALMGLAFPGTGEARIQTDLGEVSVAPGLLERLAQLWTWAEGVVADLGALLSTKGGASITPGG